jgi:hypothetical protein
LPTARPWTPAMVRAAGRPACPALLMWPVLITRVHEDCIAVSLTPVAAGPGHGLRPSCPLPRPVTVLDSSFIMVQQRAMRVANDDGTGKSFGACTNLGAGTNLGASTKTSRSFMPVPKEFPLSVALPAQTISYCLHPLV